MADQNSLKGKVAVVTGGSRGIGRAVVIMLAKQGCAVAFNYTKNEKAAREVEQEVKDIGGKAKAACVDVRNFEAVKNWIKQTKENLGGLDILINNAGINKDKTLMFMDREHWVDVIETNLNGMFYVSRACIVTFLKQKSGQIINISSVSGVNGLPGQTNYSASKGGMIAFTKSLAKEVSAYGVRVNAIAPGFIETDMLSGFKEEQKEKFVEEIPLGRLGTTDDVANCVKFLLSDHASYITGQVILVDGGMAMR